MHTFPGYDLPLVSSSFNKRVLSNALHTLDDILKSLQVRKGQFI